MPRLLKPGRLRDRVRADRVLPAQQLPGPAQRPRRPSSPPDHRGAATPRPEIALPARVDVWFGPDDKAEADVFGIRDGQILVGEVKTSATEFTPDQISRDITLSLRLKADAYVLAATDTIPDETAELAKQQCEINALGLIVLGQADLLPSG